MIHKQEDKTLWKSTILANLKGMFYCLLNNTSIQILKSGIQLKLDKKKKKRKNHKNKLFKMK